MIKSFYGGKLFLRDDQRLGFNKNSIYYWDQYRTLQKELQKEVGTQQECEHRVIIRLDIQNFYDDLVPATLLKKLEDEVRPDIKHYTKFNGATSEQIKTFLQYLMGSERGIPQADNDIISSFIAHLYMFFADRLIDDVVRAHFDGLSGYRILRYVDDIFISIDFEQTINKSEREQIVRAIGYHVSDSLYSQLSLRLNPKTRFYWMNDPADLKKFIGHLKKISGIALPPTFLEKHAPRELVDDILDCVEKLKDTSFGTSFEYEDTPSHELLKYVMNKRIRDLLKSKSVQVRIDAIFDDFNFDLVVASPRELILVIMSGNRAPSLFFNYLHNLSRVTTKDVDLILHFLCQIDFRDISLKEDLKRNEWAKPIVDMFNVASIPFNTPGYYSLPASQILSIWEQRYLLEQIQLRIISEQKGEFSVALSHLLNEIHVVAMWKDPNVGDRGKYNALEVKNFLLSQGIPNAICQKIDNLFNRRNLNNVSHPGSDDYPAWGVSRDEYTKYRNTVGECLKYLL